jgi:hypothetical protein
MMIFQLIYFFIVVLIIHSENDESPSFISLMSIQVISQNNGNVEYKESYATAFEVLAMLTNFLLML